MTNRIRWRDGDDITGSTGVCGPFAFQIYRMYAGPKWLLRAELPGMGDTHAESDDPDKLKAKAERWLEEFVSSLGAQFPDALRKVIESERDAHLVQAAETGDCPHAWRPETSCGAARALDWALGKMEAGQ